MVRLLENGEQLAKHYVYAGFSLGGNHSHSHSGEEQLKTNEHGMVSVDLTNAGQWYLRSIRMIESTTDSLDYQSDWATLTFKVK